MRTNCWSCLMRARWSADARSSRRAPEQSYRIIGQPRAAHPYRMFAGQSGACAGTGPFTASILECEGARVPWVSVVASVAEETTRRAWIEDGRLLLRMPAVLELRGRTTRARVRRASTTASASAACAVTAPTVAPWRRRHRGDAVRLCAHARHRRHIRQIAGPKHWPGAALASTGCFSTARSASQSGTRRTAATAARAEPTPLPAARPEPLPERTAKDASAQTAPPPKVSGAAHASGSTGRPSCKSAAGTCTSSAPAHRGAGGPVIPKIINRPETQAPTCPSKCGRRRQRQRRTRQATEASKNAGNPPAQEAGRRHRRRSPKADTEPTTLRSRSACSASFAAQRPASSPSAGWRSSCLRLLRWPDGASGWPVHHCARHRFGFARTQTRRGQLVPRPGPAPPPPLRGCAVAVAASAASGASPQRSAHRPPGSTEFLRRGLKPCRCWAWASRATRRKRP